MPWSSAFEEPIPVKGKTIVTLQDAANYIRKLSNAEQECPYWQIAIKQLIDSAEGRNLVMHARIGMMKALAHGHLRPTRAPLSKSAKVRRINR
jgi:hypothetical protein